MHTHRNASRGLQPPASGEDWPAGELSTQSMGLRLLSSCSRSWLCGPLIKVGNDVEIAASPYSAHPGRTGEQGGWLVGPDPGVRLECSWMPWGPAPSGLSPEPQGKQGLLGAPGTQQGVGFLLSRPCCCSCDRGPWGRLGAWPLGWSAVAAGGQAGVVCACARVFVRRSLTAGRVLRASPLGDTCRSFSTFRRMTCPLSLREEPLS